MFDIGLDSVNSFIRDVARLVNGSPDFEKPAGLGGVLAQIVNQSKSRFPVLTGDARGSIRHLQSSKVAGVIEAGEDIPYWGWLEFGGEIPTASRPYIPKGRYLFPAIESHGQDVENAFLAAVDKSLESTIGGH